MAIKGVKTMAEYAITKWMIENGFVMEYFDLVMSGNVGTIWDRQGAHMVMVYDPETKTVREKTD